MNIAVIVLVSAAAVCMAAPPKIKEECKKIPESNPTDCCAMPRGGADHKCLQDNKDNPEKLPECIFNGAKVVKDNEIDRAALLAALEVKFTGADAGFNKALHEQIANKCIERANAHKGEEGKAMTRRQVIGLMICLENEYYKNCPASAWTVSDSCAAWKKYVEECPLIFERGDEKPESQ